MNTSYPDRFISQPVAAVMRPVPPYTQKSMGSGSTLVNEPMYSVPIDKVDGGPSAWLRQKERSNRRARIFFGLVGFIVFIIMMASIGVWIGSEVFFPKQGYSTAQSQNPIQASRGQNPVSRTSTIQPSPLPLNVELGFGNDTGRVVV